MRLHDGSLGECGIGLFVADDDEHPRPQIERSFEILEARVRQAVTVGAVVVDQRSQGTAVRLTG